MPISLQSLPPDVLYDIAVQIRYAKSEDPLRPGFQSSWSDTFTLFDANRFNLCSFLQSCRQVYHSCVTILYDSIAVREGKANEEGGEFAGSLPLLLGTLQESQYLADSVKVVSLIPAIKDHPADERVEWRVLTLRLLQLCTSIRTLQSSSIPCDVIKEANLRNLQSLSIRMDPEVFDSSMAPYRCNLERLTLHWRSISPLNTFSFSLRRLKYLDVLCPLQEALSLTRILSIPAPHLENLRIFQPPYRPLVFSGIPTEPMFGKNLKVLTICRARAMFSSNKRNMGELWDCFPSLQTLCLMHDKADEIGKTDLQLPQQLKTLVLADLVYSFLSIRLFARLLRSKFSSESSLPHATEISIWTAPRSELGRLVAEDWQCDDKMQVNIVSAETQCMVCTFKSEFAVHFQQAI